MAKRVSTEYVGVRYRAPTLTVRDNIYRALVPREGNVQDIRTMLYTMWPHAHDGGMHEMGLAMLLAHTGLAAFDVLRGSTSPPTHTQQIDRGSQTLARPRSTRHGNLGILVALPKVARKSPCFRSPIVPHQYISPNVSTPEGNGSIIADCK